MLHKKAQLGITFLIIIIFLIIGVIIFFLAYINRTELEISKKEPLINYINFYIKSIDKETQLNLNSEYILQELNNDTILFNGTLNDWTELRLDSSKSYKLSCWDKNHYMESFTKTITYSDLESNSSKIICELQKIGKLKITYEGDFTRERNIINLNISSDNFKKLMVCEAHSIGITSLDLLEKAIRCDIGSWKNWTSINQTTKQPVFLTNDTYVCGNDKDWFTYCKKSVKNVCYYKEAIIPVPLKNKVDHCFYIGKNLKNSSIVLNFEVYIFNLSPRDYIDFYIIDSEQRYLDNQFKYISYLNNNGDYEDLGLETYKYSIGDIL